MRRRVESRPIDLRDADVANYNALTAASPDPITQGNPNYDEIHYINVSIPSALMRPPVS